MKEVKVQRRYQCDFCKYRSTRSHVEKHEKRCFRNPNRFCDFCENKGYTVDYEHNGEMQWKVQVQCPYCSSFDPKIKQAIEAREAQSQPPQSTPTEIPL